MVKLADLAEQFTSRLRQAFEFKIMKIPKPRKRGEVCFTKKITKYKISSLSKDKVNE